MAMLFFTSTVHKVRFVKTVMLKRLGGGSFCDLAPVRTQDLEKIVALRQTRYHTSGEKSS